MTESWAVVVIVLATVAPIGIACWFWCRVIDIVFDILKEKK